MIKLLTVVIYYENLLLKLLTSTKYSSQKISFVTALNVYKNCTIILLNKL